MISEQLQKKVDRALNLLKMSASKDGSPVEIAYSGGKDSDVILQLAKESGINFRAIYRNTTIDPPGTVAHVKEKGAEIIMPKRTFAQLIASKGQPSRTRRFCCSELKEYKILDRCVMGVRKAESRKRNEMYNEPTECRLYRNKKEHVEAIYPILDWTDEDVKSFIVERGIKCAPVYYDKNGEFHVERRLGCMCCPLASQNKRIAEFKKYPKMVRLYLRNIKKFMDTHPNSVVVRTNKDCYSAFVRELFFLEPGAFDYENSLSLFGDTPDWKCFLERKFGIDLTL